MSAGGILGEFAQQGRVLHRQIRRTMCHPTRRKKPCPSPYPKIPPKATGLSHAYFQSHLADSQTGFTRSVRSYPPIPIWSLSDARCQTFCSALSGQRRVIAVLGCLFLSSFDNVPACLTPHIFEAHLFFMQQTVDFRD